LTEIAVKETGHGALLLLLTRSFETILSIKCFLLEFLGKLFELLCAEEVDIRSQSYTDDIYLVSGALPFVLASTFR
jgi:hypothetical protein